MSTTVTIDTIDTSGSGATATGTTRDHAEVMRTNRWRWSRNLGAWYLPRTFRPETVDLYVDKTTAALRAAGLEVELIDGPRDDDATRTARRLQRDRDLVEIHGQRATTAHAGADAEWAKAKGILDVIPPGQPILAGHHSERRHRGDLARVDRAMRRSIDAQADAERHESRAAAAAQRVHAAETERTVIDPATIRSGDYIRAETPIERRSSGWHRVIRVNRKTVTIPALVGGADVSWTDRIPLDHIVELRPADRTDAEVDPGEAADPGGPSRTLGERA
jgi:hypothetical protein